MEPPSLYSDKIIKEIASLKMAAHADKITFLGICIDLPMHIHLLLKFVDGFNLKEVLVKQKLKKEFLTTEEDKHRMCYRLTKAILPTCMVIRLNSNKEI